MAKKKKRYVLNNTRVSKLKKDFLDYDYVNSLSNDEKKWLNKFTEEYYQGYFRKSRGKIRDSLHKTDSQRRSCYNQNNANNRDLYAILKATDLFNNVDGDSDKIIQTLSKATDVESALESLQVLLQFGIIKEEDAEELMYFIFS
jgi:hypothetical protein